MASLAKRVSGSDSGRGPEYCGSPRRPIGRHSDGKLRLRSTPRAFVRTPSRRPSGVRSGTGSADEVGAVVVDGDLGLGHGLGGVDGPVAIGAVWVRRHADPRANARRVAELLDLAPRIVVLTNADAEADNGRWVVIGSGRL